MYIYLLLREMDGPVMDRGNGEFYLFRFEGKQISGIRDFLPAFAATFILGLNEDSDKYFEKVFSKSENDSSGLNALSEINRLGG